MFFFLQYKCTDVVCEKPGKVELLYSPHDGSPPQKFEVFNFQETGGVTMGMYNTDEVSFAFNFCRSMYNKALFMLFKKNIKKFIT